MKFKQGYSSKYILINKSSGSVRRVICNAIIIQNDMYLVITIVILEDTSIKENYSSQYS